MFNWFWKWLGYHVCEEFTPWELRQANFTRPADMEEHVWGEVTVIEFTRFWQDRRCKVCGKTQRESLPSR